MIEKLREELIKDIISYLEGEHNENSTQRVRIENTITQIIVDSFDEYELNNKK